MVALGGRDRVNVHLAGPCRKECQIMGIEVKTVASVFKDVWARKKFSELRLDDGKDYRIGATLTQWEWMKSKKKKTGRFVTGQISAITRLNHWVPDVDHRWVIVHLDPDTVVKGRSSGNVL